MAEHIVPYTPPFIILPPAPRAARRIQSARHPTEAVVN